MVFLLIAGSLLIGAAILSGARFWPIVLYGILLGTTVIFIIQKQGYVYPFSVFPYGFALACVPVLSSVCLGLCRKGHFYEVLEQNHSQPLYDKTLFAKILIIALVIICSPPLGIHVYSSRFVAVALALVLMGIWRAQKGKNFADMVFYLWFSAGGLLLIALPGSIAGIVVVILFYSVLNVLSARYRKSRQTNTRVSL